MGTSLIWDIMQLQLVVTVASGRTDRSETLVSNYQSTLHDIPELSSHLQHVLGNPHLTYVL
jgi:hypothetical protein